MKSDIENTVAIKPINQLNLFGYEKYFNFFVKLFKERELPNSILLSGPKGSGKATFVYHFINYILSNEEKKITQLLNMKLTMITKVTNLFVIICIQIFFHLKTT